MSIDAADHHVAPAPHASASGADHGATPSDAAANADVGNGTASHPTDRGDVPSAATPLTLTRDEARLLAVAAQGLDRRPRGRATRARLLATIRHLGCVQLDTISVVSRSHETVLWSRLGPYDPADLAALHYPDGHLIEYWAHAAALVPVELFPCFRRMMAFYADRDGWAVANRDVLDRVLARVRDGGPVASRDFERPDGVAAGPWDWYGAKPDRRALDALWTAGELMVLKRDGFQRTYELTERVLPGALDGDPPPLAEQHRTFTRRALAALGVATPRWAADYFRTGSRPHLPPAAAAATLAALADAGEAVPATVDGLAEPAWVAPGMLGRLADLRAGRGRPTLTTLLSPFDNLIWTRARTEALFGFEYRLESYTPAPKRRYGYYTLPILHRGRLVGRLDPSYDRKSRFLTVRALHLEPGVRPTAALAAAVAWALSDLATFLGAAEVGVLLSDPEPFAPLVQSALGETLSSPARGASDTPLAER